VFVCNRRATTVRGFTLRIASSHTLHRPTFPDVAPNYCEILDFEDAGSGPYELRETYNGVTTLLARDGYVSGANFRDELIGFDIDETGVASYGIRDHR
jgi:hypothetical protein